jgi:hypothetical protein
MGFSDRYELLELLRDDGIKTFGAREIATGRAIWVFLLTGVPPQTARELLDQVQSLTDRNVSELIETGDNQGTPYVVAEILPGMLNLRDWLSTELERYGVPKPAGNLDHLTRVGRWQIPVAPPQPPAPQPSQAAPGEFTRMFQAGAPPAPIAEPAPPQPQAGPGEFTRMFQAGAPPAPLAEPAPPQPQAGPGEFTRMFQAGAPPAPLAEPALVQPPAPPQPQTGPGEFTRFFASPLPAPEPARPMQFPTPAVPPAAAPAPPSASYAPPGEFTGIFGKSDAGAPRAMPPIAPIAPQAPAPSAGPGEYTRMFGPRMDPPSASVSPATPAPAPAAAPVRKSSNLPLILILAGLFLVALLVVVFFALKK